MKTVPSHMQPLTETQVADYHRDGYVIVRGHFTPEEMTGLLAYARGDTGLQMASGTMRDAAGRASRLTLWSEPGTDLYGVISRCRRVAGAASQLLGEEAYHWHSKMMLKEPRVGGAWEWHQDYGYWYNDTCLAPQLLSCLVAVDRATPANGCLQVLRGSHLLGRVEHGKFGEQVGADPIRVQAAKARLELVHVALEPGDTLFFHCNTLHASGANTSDDPRWSLIMTYNARSNSPFGSSPFPTYRPLAVVDDSDVLAWLRSPPADIRPSYREIPGAGFFN